MNGLKMIEEARVAQIRKGFTAEHDDVQETMDQLAVAAGILAMPKYLRAHEQVVGFWPWEDYPPPSTDVATIDDVDQRLDELAKAGALCAAEIDRLLRKQGVPVG